MTSLGPGGWSPPHTDHMRRVRGGTLVSQKKEGAQVSPLSLQGSRGAVTLGFRNSSCGSGGRHLPAPKMPIRLSLLMSLRVPRKQRLKQANMDGPLRGHTGRRAGRLSLTSPTLPHCTLGCLPVFITRHLGCFLRGCSSRHQPGGEKQPRGHLLINETVQWPFKGKPIRLLMGFLIWQEEEG